MKLHSRSAAVSTLHGGETVARRLVEALPGAQLELLPGAGHLCWFDDVEHATRTVRTHLLGSSPQPDDQPGPAASTARA